MSGSSTEETALLARCLQGEAEAWNTLFDQHYSAAAAFVFQLGYQLNRQDVEEICQETFLSVIRNLPSFQGQCQFQTWLFRIAANKSRDYKDRQQAAKRGGKSVTVSIQEEDPQTGLKLDPPSPRPGPDVALVQEENIALVGQGLEILGGPCEEIIGLRYFADLSYEEISNCLQLNPKTVSSRLSKCLDKLEVILKKLILQETNPPAPV